MAERLRLVPTKGAERGVVSINPGGVGSQVTFLRAHLMDAACHKFSWAHERIWREVQWVGGVVWEVERAPMLHHERLCQLLQGAVGVGHDFVAR